MDTVAESHESVYAEYQRLRYEYEYRTISVAGMARMAYLEATLDIEGWEDAREDDDDEANE